MLVATGAAEAHRLDECLQGAFVSVGTNRLSVELNLTPGVAVAETFFQRADLNRDGSVSPEESRSFGQEVARSVSLALDGAVRPLEGAVGRFPALDELRTGSAVIQLEWVTAPLELTPGPHEVTFRNTWEPVPSVRLANAVMPESPRIRVVRQRRDASQGELVIDLAVEAPAPAVPPVASGPPVSRRMLVVLLGLAVAAGVGSRLWRLGWGSAD
jgi:hypothetical protein